MDEFAVIPEYLIKYLSLNILLLSYYFKYWIIKMFILVFTYLILMTSFGVGYIWGGIKSVGDSVKAFFQL
jgi:hypothetical protein